jgi:beta-ureidopropionase / N-carbamoyl-L-amino-acid hydrolase
VTATPAVDGDRLWSSIQDMAAIGAVASGGVRRIALSPRDIAGRDLLRSWASELGCTWRCDPAGNLFIHRPGAIGGPAVGVGSHLDTQPEGGAFDGALGVLAGLEVLRALEERGVRTRLPLELVVWTDEEGARFDVSCVGSSLYAGSLDLQRARALVDGEGVTFGEALDLSGESGDLELGNPPLEAYFELHIEQGPSLEARGTQIGVVEGIVGIRWLEVLLEGAQNHAGTTPMSARADALEAAARVVSAVRRIGEGHGPDGRGTVCVLDVEPNAGSVIPGRVRMVVDLRHASEPALDAMARELATALERLPASVRARPARELWAQPPIAFDSGCVALVEDSARRLGLSATRMLSGAGHDAGYVSMVAPTAMIFVPCRGGVSHHPDEHASHEQVAAGASVLLEAVLERAGADRSVIDFVDCRQ